MSKNQKTTKSSILKPIIHVEGAVHPLTKLFDGPEEQIPELTAIGYAPIGNGPSRWVSYVMKTKGDKILSIEISEPDMRAIAEESSKIAFVNSFMNEGL